MTLFGWDSSHYDGVLTRTTLARAKAEGIDIFTHKVGEGVGGDDAQDATALAAARDVGIEFIGGYHVVRSGPVAPQVDALLALADRDEPWWRAFHGWFWQVDLERWPYDNVPAATGVEFGKLLRARTGRLVVLYASRGQYGDSLTAWDGPLWNAAYGTNPVGAFKAVYPGDASTRWAPYSGQTPTFLQYGSNTSIAGLSTCDANAYRGTLEQLRALFSDGDDMDQQQAFQLEDVWHVAKGLAAGLDSAPVHDHDGVLDLTAFYRRVAAEVAKLNTVQVDNTAAIVAGVRDAIADGAEAGAAALRTQTP